MKKIVESGFEL